MNKYFITYGDKGYEQAKARIVQEANSTGEFQEIFSFGREDLSPELLSSDVINIKRGGGLWSWKPDVILSVMNKVEEGAAIIYCDAGCSVYPSKEWKRIWNRLENHDIIAQRIFQRTDRWTRKELLDLFKSNGKYWPKCYQYQATPIFKNTPFARKFVKEWRDLMISNPKLVMDVTEEERPMQHASLIENRHDQTVFSALVYKYLANPDTREFIYSKWEHIEDYDPFCKQAIRATRLRLGEKEIASGKIIGCAKRLIKDFMLKPFYYAPQQWWYSRK